MRDRLQLLCSHKLIFMTDKSAKDKINRGEGANERRRMKNLTNYFSFEDWPTTKDKESLCRSWEPLALLSTTEWGNSVSNSMDVLTLTK